MKRKSLSILLLGASLATAGPLCANSPPPGYALLTGDASVSAGALKAAIDPLFDPAAKAGLGETRALLVLHDGHLIAERYAPGFGPNLRLSSGAIARTVTALLVGIMVADGRLALDDPAPVPAWHQRGDPRGAITLRELLQMRSGLDAQDKRGPLGPADALAMLVGPGSQDQLRYAQARPLVQTPGTLFTDSGGNSVILGGIVTRLLTDSSDPQIRRDAMMQFIRSRFAGPLGLTSFVPEFDARGTLLAGTMMHMSARDYAKVGEFMRLRGRVGDRQLLSDRWIDFMTSPSSANPAYGGQLWLNRSGKDNPLFPGETRPSLFGAVGDHGQYVIVSPDQKLTIVRLGVTKDDDLPALRHALARLVRGLP